MNVVAMAPLVIECPNAECALGADGARYETQALEPDLAMRLLKLHVKQNHAGPVRAGDGDGTTGGKTRLEGEFLSKLR